MEAIVDNHDHQDDLFTDSDTDYANVDDVNVKKKKRKVLASPRVSKQLKKSRSESSNGDIEFKSFIRPSKFFISALSSSVLKECCNF